MIHKCYCHNCSGGIEIESETFEHGATIQCPHCGKETVLVSTNAPPPILKRKSKIMPRLLWWVVLPIVVIFFLIFMVHEASILPSGNDSADAQQPISESIAGLIMFGVGGLFLLFIYFLPSVIVMVRGRKNSGAIVALNVLAGWTFFGWIIALIWAITEDK